MTTSAMVDTMVLSYAFVAEAPVDDDHKQKKQASQVLLMSMEVVRVSAITWIELCRVVEPESLGPLREQILVEAVDAAIAEQAARILNKFRASEDVCRKCLSSTRSGRCACGRVVSRHQKVNDALILATAEQLAQVDTLFTYDGGILELGHYVECDVRKPPSPHGELFETAQGEANVVPISKKRRE
jgi:predicted nucleic acid-binding protein